MGAMIGGHATAEGTARYRERFAGRLPAEHFRELTGGAWASSIGIGTYLGREDAANRLLALAGGGHSSRLVAPRRYGKTSLLRRVLAHAAAEGWATRL